MFLFTIAFKLLNIVNTIHTPTFQVVKKCLVFVCTLICLKDDNIRQFRPAILYNIICNKENVLCLPYESKITPMADYLGGLSLCYLNFRKSFTRWVSQQECFRSRCPNDWGLKQKKRKKGDDNVEDYYYDEDEDGYHGYFKVDIFGFQSIYRFFFLICSIAAIPLRGYTYPFCLFYVFLKVDVVQYILTALHRSGKFFVV